MDVGDVGNVSGIAALATEMATTRTAQAAQLAVLQMAMEIEGQGALQLLDAAVSAPVAINPPHLGNQVDTFA